MKGLKEIVLAGALVLGVAGCSDYVGASDGYSCKRTGDAIEATKGDAEVRYSGSILYDKEIEFENMTRHEAVSAIDACIYAFKLLDSEKKSDK
jgi:hypothetical protein